MSRTTKALCVLVVSFLGLWGCTQGPAGSTALAERVKALEMKCARLEEDYRTVALARDQARKQSAALEQDKTQLEEQRTRLQKELDQLRLVVKERDRLRQELDAKTKQRDVLQARCDKLKNGLKSLMSDDDAMLPGSPAGETTVSDAGARR